MSSPINSSQWMYASGGFYGHEISNSLRLNDGDSPHLAITPGSAGNRKTFTWSAWIKLGALANGSNQITLFDASSSSSEQHGIVYSGQQFYVFGYTSSFTYRKLLTAQHRDPMAWMNLVVAFDTTDSTAADRIKIYVNGTRQTDFSGTNTNPSEDYETGFNNTVAHGLGGRIYDTANYFDGYIAEVNLIDGTALTPASFGETKSGIWIPKNTSGLTFGTNGFRLEFKQTGTSQNASGIGADTSGETNHFAVTNLVAGDVTPDTPTNNFCTFNPISDDDQVANTFSEGNLGVTPPGSGGFESAVATFALPRTGKWYWEYRTGQGGGSIYGRPSIITVDEFYTQNGADARDEVTGGSAATNPNGILFTANDGGKRINNSDTSFGSAVSAGDKIGLAYNAGTGQLFIYINNSIQASGAAINESIKGNFAGKDVFIMHERYNGNGLDLYNFGQDSSFAGAETAQGNADGEGFGDFYYAPPSGFLALCSANLPEPAISPLDGQVSD